MTTTYLTASDVRRRYGQVSDMALRRWINSPEMDFPKPLVMNGRRLFRVDDLDAFDARLQGEAA